MAIRRINFSRAAARLGCQIGVSAMATIVATFIVGSLPHFGSPAETTTAVLTSGGKFAARIPVAAGSNAEAATPLPLLTLISAASPELGTALVPDADEWRPAALAPPATAVRPARPKVRSVATRIDRHVAETVLPSMPGAPTVAASLPDEGGMLTRAVAGARSIWSTTTATGGALISHLMP